MRYFIPATLVLALAACEPPTPNSGTGVGFNSYEDYERDRAAREAAQRRAAEQKRAESAQKAVSDEAVAGGSETAQTSQTGAPLSALASNDPAEQAPGQQEPFRRADPNNPDISDEQEFGAVSGRESIESDRERLQGQREQYTVIAPKAVPTRSGSGGPNVVEFALSTTNAVGQSIYKRSKVFASSRYRRNCAKYSSPDLAQLAFLKSGGPQRDSKGVDPDGDGFACSWDPTAFRNAKRN